jgi:hypothetical protein
MPRRPRSHAWVSGFFDHCGSEHRIARPRTRDLRGEYFPNKAARTVPKSLASLGLAQARSITLSLANYEAVPSAVVPLMRSSPSFMWHYPSRR